MRKNHQVKPASKITRVDSVRTSMQLPPICSTMFIVPLRHSTLLQA